MTMQQIKDLEQIKGKKIERALLVNCNESLFIGFSDESFLVVGIDKDYDSYEIDVSEELGAFYLEKAGIISKEELSNIKAREADERQEARKQQELDLLRKLQKKYEGEL